MDAKLTKILDQISELSVLELSDLVKALEEKFDVKAAAAGPVAASATPGAVPAPVEEKTEFDVVITNAGTNKIAVIKVVREFKPELGLKEAKDIVDAAPKVVKENVAKADAEAMKKKIEDAGGKCTLK